MPTSSRMCGSGSRRAASPVRSISRAPVERRRSGAARGGRGTVASAAASRAATSEESSTKRRVLSSVSSISVVVPATMTAPPAARLRGPARPAAPRTAAPGPGRAARRRSRAVRSSSAPAGGGGVGQDAAAEPARARDDAPARVDHLHQQRAAAEPALERAGLGEQLRGGGGEPGDLGGARPELAVQRVVELVVEPCEHGDAEGRDGHHDRHRGGGRDARLEAHSSLKPTPRTVWMSGGSPSLRRR